MNEIKMSYEVFNILCSMLKEPGFAPFYWLENGDLGYNEDWNKVAEDEWEEDE